MSTTNPSSTAGRSTSCWDLLNRWTSSTKSMVPCPCSPRRRCASVSASRTSFTPAAVAERVTRCLAVVAANKRANVVLPVPAGPHKMAEPTRSLSARARNGAPGPDEMLLAHHVVERARPQAGGQRRLALQVPVGGVGEETQVDGRTGGPGGAGGGATVRMPSSARARGRQGARGAGEEIGAGLRLRVGDHLTDVLLPGQYRRQAIDAESEAGMRRGAVAEGAEEEAEPGLRLLGC